MILLENIVETIINEEGMFLLGMDYITNTLGLTWKRMETIFVKSAAEYSRRRPVEVTQIMTSAPIIRMPATTLAVKAVRYGVLPEYPRYFQDSFDEISFEYDHTSKLLRVFPPNTQIKVTYDTALTTANNIIVRDMFYTVDGQSEIEGTLQGTYLKGTLKVHSMYGDMAEISRTVSEGVDFDNNPIEITTINLSGTLGTGTINADTREFSLNLNSTSISEITFEYYPKYKCVYELSSDLGDFVFFKLFAYNLLKSIATLRAQATQPDIHNIDLTNDGLPERVAALGTEVRKLMKSSISFGGLAGL